MSDERFAHLPAAEILAEGTRDLGAGRRTLPAFLVAMAWPRLEPLSIVRHEDVSRVRIPGEDLEISAYRILARDLGREAHGRYLALTAELDSAISALEREARRRRRDAPPAP
jgi:hypothetical protein